MVEMAKAPMTNIREGVGGLLRSRSAGSTHAWQSYCPARFQARCVRLEATISGKAESGVGCTRLLADGAILFIANRIHFNVLGNGPRNGLALCTGPASDAARFLYATIRRILEECKMRALFGNVIKHDKSGGMVHDHVGAILEIPGAESAFFQLKILCN